MQGQAYHCQKPINIKGVPQEEIFLSKSRCLGEQINLGYHLKLVQTVNLDGQVDHVLKCEERFLFSLTILALPHY